MSKIDDDFNGELGEVFRPANSCLVRWSFGLGFVMLVALIGMSHLVH